MTAIKKKMGRPLLPDDKKRTPRSIAFTQKELDFLNKQSPNAAAFVRSLVKKAMIEAGENVSQ